jgi:hypothetical protein
MTPIPRLRLLALILLASSPAAAQEFRVERDLDLIRGAGGQALHSIYWVSLPLDPDLPDGASSASATTNKCVGEPGGPTTADGVLDSDDLICAWWTARALPATAGGFTVSKMDPRSCTLISRNATVALGAIRFTGQAFDFEPDAGYQVQVSAPATASWSPRNHAILTGDDDPLWPGRPIVSLPTCTAGMTTDCCGANQARASLVALPFDAMYAHSDEVLCGLENVDWTDAGGAPNRCWDDADSDGRYDAGEALTGIFDGRTASTVVTYRHLGDDHSMVARTAVLALGRFRLTGMRFPLAAGEAYMFVRSLSSFPVLWDPPRF